MRGYGCPHEELDEGLLNELAFAHASETLRRFLAAYSRSLRKHGSGIVGFLEEAFRDPKPFEVVWDPAFARCYAAILKSNRCDATNIAAAVGLRLGARGSTGEWSLTLEDPSVQLCWDTWLLPKAERIDVATHGKSADIRAYYSGSYTTVRFSRSGFGWAGEGAQQILTFGTEESRIALLTRQALNPRDSYELPAGVERRIDKAFFEGCQEAVNIMAHHAPMYRAWVERAVRHIVVLEKQPGGGPSYSGSSSGDFGLIHVCAANNPINLAEILVHEAAHQYYYILCRLGPVDDGTDNNLYFSPLVGTTRRIDRILLAYHAVANILMFAQILRANGARCTERFSEQQENVLRKELDQLEAPLRNNPSLTQIGKAILEPLLRNIHQGS